MNPPLPTSYDEFEYPGAGRPQIHPRRLWMLARMLGLDPPPVAGARILELGCGDAAQLLWIADEFRDARCVGIDLALAGLARGRAAAAAMGLTNVELLHVDVCDVGEELGEFDYIIAHGLYSWVPEAVREHLMRLCSPHLGRQGIAVISYNAYPGCHLRRVVQDALRFHASGKAMSADQVAAAKEMARFLAAASHGNRPYDWVLRDELKTLEGTSDAALFHDDLADTNDPVYLVDFVAHARRHGLAYLCDVALPTAFAAGPDAEAAAAIAGFTSDRVVAEQYRDFVQGRRFRHSLLHRSDREPDFAGAPERTLAMFAAASLQHEASTEQLLGSAEVKFSGEPPRTMTLAHPFLKCVLHLLAEAWPNPLAAEHLLTAGREMVGHDANTLASDRRTLGALLHQMVSLEMVTLMDTPWAATAVPGERPCASALARWEASHGRVRLTGCDGSKVSIDEEISRRFVCLLDGTRTLDELVDVMFAAVERGEIALPAPLQEAWAAGAGREILASGVAGNLQMLARQGVLRETRE